MVTIDYNKMDYAKLLADFAGDMGTVVKNNSFIIPEEIGTGYFTNLNLSNGLQCLLCDVTLNQDLYLQQKRSIKEFYILRLDEISTAKTLMVKIDNDYTWEESQNRASAFLTSSLFDFAYALDKDTSIKSINILIPRKWINEYLDIKTFEGILSKYLELKTAVYNFAPFDVEYRALFNEVMNNRSNDVMRRSITENRIMLMIEKFLYYLYQNGEQLSVGEKHKLTESELKRLMEVESYLVKDFSTPPPSISYLSKVAAMSATSLKNKFKKIYGNTLYEYFQKNRMQRAKTLIMSHKYSIKEIGSQLGYSNLSNFATAFKKEFNSLPSQLVLHK